MLIIINLLKVYIKSKIKLQVLQHQKITCLFICLMQSLPKISLLNSLPEQVFLVVPSSLIEN